MFIFIDIILIPEPKSTLCWKIKFLKLTVTPLGKMYIPFLPHLQQPLDYRMNTLKTSNRMEMHLKLWDFKP